MSKRRRHRPRQAEFKFRTWGGKRKNAGRKPKGEKPGVPHATRANPGRLRPVHVTMRVLDTVWNLRTKEAFRVVERALLNGAERFGGRLIRYSVQRNHIHLLVEVDNRKALIRFCQGLAIRLAKNLNSQMSKSGPVIADRYHARTLKTPSEVRNAIHYILQNGRKHLAQIGIRRPPSWIDPCCSLNGRIPLPKPRGWLLKQAAFP